MSPPFLSLEEQMKALAQDCVDRCEGNTHRAAQLLRHRLRTERRDLGGPYIEQCFNEGTDQLIQLCRRPSFAKLGDAVGNKIPQGTTFSVSSIQDLSPAEPDIEIPSAARSLLTSKDALPHSEPESGEAIGLLSSERTLPRRANLPRVSPQALMRGQRGALTRCILDIEMINGRPMRFADREECLTAAERFRGKAWLIEILVNDAPPGMPIGEFLTDEEAERRHRYALSVDVDKRPTIEARMPEDYRHV